MPERQTIERLESSTDPSCVNKIRVQGWDSDDTDDTKVDAIRTITLCQGSENSQEAISSMGWRSASILPRSASFVQQDGQCNVVAHSYGGAVITEAGTDPSVAGLAHVAAHMPDAGESEADDGNDSQVTSEGLLR